MAGRGPPNVLWGSKDPLPFGISVTSAVAETGEWLTHIHTSAFTSAFLHYSSPLQLALAINSILTDEIEREVFGEGVPSHLKHS